MAKGQNIRDAVKKLTDTASEIYSIICEVSTVDTGKRVCVVNPIDGSPKIFGVRYSPTKGDSLGLIMNPTVGSMVVVTFLDDHNAFISLMTEFDTVLFKNGEADLKKILNDLIAMIEKITVPTPSGASATPINYAELTPIKTDIENLFE
jgi:hypothetical protein